VLIKFRSVKCGFYLDFVDITMLSNDVTDWSGPQARRAKQLLGVVIAKRELAILARALCEQRKRSIIIRQ